MKQYAICINNHGNKASLILRKAYELSDKPSTVKGRIRVIDEDGDEALYSVKNFVIIFRLIKKSKKIFINLQFKNSFLSNWQTPIIRAELNVASFGCNIMCLNH